MGGAACDALENSLLRLRRAFLKIEDVVPLTEATPEQNVGQEELRKYFHDALARMPNNWRRAM